MKIIDSHVHIPSPEWSGHDNYFKSVKSAVDYLLKKGTSAAIFNTWQGVFSKTAEDLDQANEEALRLSREYKGFLYPGIVIHPDFPEKSKEWLKRFRDKGYLWVGELVPYAVKKEFDEAPWMKLFEECCNFGHSVQLHNSQAVVAVTKAFPEMQVICSHINKDLMSQLAPLKNAWIDLSGSAGGLKIGEMEAAKEIMGVDRLFYGTDFTNYEPEAFISRVKTAFESEDEQKKIFSANLKLFLKNLGANSISISNL